METDTDEVTDIDENEDEFAIPAGNGILLEDVSDSEINRQFLTIQSKGGNTFYIVIDKDMKGNENVYFMNLVDEYDLLAFSEDFPENAPINVGKDKKTSANTEETDDETADMDGESNEDTETPANENAENGSNTIILLVGAALLVDGGAFYYFKIYKGKSNKPKVTAPDDDEDDEPEIEDPNDDEKPETDDTDE